MRRTLALSLAFFLPAFAQDNKSGFKISSEVNQVKVEQAIARGINFLKTSDSPVEASVGGDSDELKLLTFVHGGVAENDAAFEDVGHKLLSA